MSADFDELMNEEEKYSNSIRKANDQFMRGARGGHAGGTRGHGGSRGARVRPSVKLT